MRLDHLLSKGRVGGEGCFIIVCSWRVNTEKLAMKRIGETRVPISNTKVKTYSAEGSILETVCENRRLPVFIGDILCI